MPIGVVSKDDRGMGVLDGGPHAPREGKVLGVYRSHWGGLVRILSTPLASFIDSSM